jgi:hypothetical protein
MNYEKIYNQIIKKALSEVRVRNTGTYYELHHILPKCLGGTNSKENLVNLTAKEHFICHRLLCEIYPENEKLKFALWMMCNSKNQNQGNRHVPSSKVYERIRTSHAEFLSNHMKGAEPINKGVPMSDTQKKKISDSNKGKKMSEECIEKRKASRKGFQFSEESKKRISEGNTGKIRTKEFKDNLSKMYKGRVAPNKGKSTPDHVRRKIAESMKKMRLEKGNEQNDKIRFVDKLD